MGGSQHSRAYEVFRKRLRQARIQAGFTQVEVGERLGISQGMVSKCESGERRVDVIELARFAKLYGKKLGYFVPRMGH